jgi:hypothetical protein
VSADKSLLSVTGFALGPGSVVRNKPAKNVRNKEYKIPQNISGLRQHARFSAKVVRS